MSTGDATTFTTERRTRPQSTTPNEVLRQIPAQVILDRMTTPVIGLSNGGDIVYANHAYSAMLGYAAGSVLEQPLSALLIGHESKAPAECIATLRDAGSEVISWSHAEGFPVHTMVSNPLLLRATDPLLIFNVSDITELLWGERSREHRL